MELQKFTPMCAKESATPATRRFFGKKKTISYPLRKRRVAGVAALALAFLHGGGEGWGVGSIRSNRCDVSSQFSLQVL